MQPSLVQRLRDSVTQCRALDRSQLLDEAAAEIERLLEQSNQTGGDSSQVTLTDAERDAIEGAIVHMESRGVWAWPATLRELLWRIK